MRSETNIKQYNCPTCGYPNLDEPAWDPVSSEPSFNICPCCGCEFGYNDAKPEGRSEYRIKWLHEGAFWFQPKLKPANWNLKEQLRGIGIDYNCC